MSWRRLRRVPLVKTEVARRRVVDSLYIHNGIGLILLLLFGFENPNVGILRPLLVVEANDGELLAKCPPPFKGLPHGKLVVLDPISLLEHFDIGHDSDERPRRPPIVGHHGDVARVFEDGHILIVAQPDLLQHPRPLGLSQDVVVQGPLGNLEPRRSLSESHLLRKHRGDGLSKLSLRPGGQLATFGRDHVVVVEVGLRGFGGCRRRGCFLGF